MSPHKMFLPMAFLAILSAPGAADAQQLGKITLPRSVLIRANQVIR